jgi:HupE / UreJ protein
MRSGVCFVLCLLLSPAALAHKASTSYTHITVSGSQLTGRMEVAIRDLDVALNLDSDGDGEIRWREVKDARPRIAAYLLNGFSVSQGDSRCALSATDLHVVAHSDGNYAVMGLEGSCAREIGRISLDYQLLFDLDPLHRGLIAVSYPPDGTPINLMFSPDSHRLDVESAHPELLRVFGQYFWAGLVHVWSGLDHLLFLAGLFLPAVLRRVNGRWEPVANLPTALRDMAWIVTAFTLAHAFTLTLAATGAFKLPSRVVESAVALTVLFAGLNNVVPIVYKELFWLSGAFGLIHGAAVASALIDMGLPGTGRVWALLAFNLGVEAAQLSLLALVILPAFAARRSRFYRQGILVPGSIVVTAVGACWFVERSFDIYFGVPLP